MDRPDFTLSEMKRISFVRDQLIMWMLNNKIEMYEVKRAIAMEMRIEDERRSESLLQGRKH